MVKTLLKLPFIFSPCISVVIGHSLFWKHLSTQNHLTHLLVFTKYLQ